MINIKEVLLVFLLGLSGCAPFQQITPNEVQKRRLSHLEKKATSYLTNSSKELVEDLPVYIAELENHEMPTDAKAAAVYSRNWIHGRAIYIDNDSMMHHSAEGYLLHEYSHHIYDMLTDKQKEEFNTHFSNLDELIIQKFAAEKARPYTDYHDDELFCYTVQLWLIEKHEISLELETFFLQFYDPK